jgi:hypothetical protein
MTYKTKSLRCDKKKNIMLRNFHQISTPYYYNEYYILKDDMGFYYGVDTHTNNIGRISNNKFCPLIFSIRKLQENNKILFNQIDLDDPPEQLKLNLKLSKNVEIIVFSVNNFDKSSSFPIGVLQSENSNLNILKKYLQNPAIANKQLLKLQFFLNDDDLTTFKLMRGSTYYSLNPETNLLQLSNQKFKFSKFTLVKWDDYKNDIQTWKENLQSSGKNNDNEQIPEIENHDKVENSQSEMQLSHGNVETKSIFTDSIHTDNVDNFHNHQKNETERNVLTHASSLQTAKTSQKKVSILPLLLNLFLILILGSIFVYIIFKI